MEERIFKRPLLKRKKMASDVLLFCSIHESSAGFVNDGFHSSLSPAKRGSSVLINIRCQECRLTTGIRCCRVEGLIQCSLCKQEQGTIHNRRSSGLNPCRSKGGVDSIGRRGGHVECWSGRELGHHDFSIMEKWIFKIIFVKFN